MTSRVLHTGGQPLSTTADGGVDQVAAMTMTYPAEAVGIARAAAGAGVPAVVSSTVETDGRLPDGTDLRHVSAPYAACDVRRPRRQRPRRRPAC